MKSENIVRRLKKEGYNITYKKWAYWDGVPHVEFDGFSFAIADYTHVDGGVSINRDFIYNHVQDALNLAELNNPIILKKIKESPSEDYYYYLQYMIRSMQDYYLYKKKKYPFNQYWDIINKLEKELNR